MSYFKFAVWEAWLNTWERLTEGLWPAMIALAIFSLTTILAHKIRGKEESEEYLWDGVLGFCATFIVGVLVFFGYLFVVNPAREHRSLEKAQIDLKDLTEKKRTEEGDLKIAQDRATRLSDALAMGKNDFLDEPIATVEITSTIQTEMAKPEKVGFIGSGVSVVLVRDDLPSADLSFKDCLLLAHCRSGDSLQTSPQEAAYRFICSADIDSMALDKPISFLSESKKIYIAALSTLIPAGTQVLRGEIILLINDRYRLIFQIQPQQAIGYGDLTAIVVTNLTNGMKPLTTSASSIPDKSTSPP